MLSKLLSSMKGFEIKKYGLWVYDSYRYIFDSSRNPLRHIPDPTSRMFIMMILGFTWSGALRLIWGVLFTSE